MINYLEIKKLIKECDAILIGLGSGMSASGGLDYMSEDVFEKLYPDFYKKGYKYIFHALSDHWVTSINKTNEKSYWEFWCRHIYNVRYNIDTLEPYKLLKDIVADKEYFVVTTNGDGQSQRVFNDVYAPQGDYSLFQCRVNCNNKVYNNKEFIYSNLNELKEIPKCSCGDYLIPNLRCDDYFCETTAQDNYDKYFEFLLKNKDRKLLLIEIGVGYNTPSIIRFPFDKLSSLDNINFIRINISDSKCNGIGINEDILNILKQIKE